MEKTSYYDYVIVIGEDVDLLVLLCGLGSTIQNLRFQKRARGRSEAGCIQYTTSAFNKGEVEVPSGFQLFLHAFSGCDTTSALFWQGKRKLWGQFQKRQELVDLAAIFLLADATHESIAKAGEKCLVALYGGDPATQRLHELRFQLFVKAATNAKVNLARLPPTTAASSFHAFRTYHQVQKWLGVEKDPTDWGWKTSPCGLIPIATDKEPAPSQLLKIIACKCKKGCKGACTCLKAGLKCSSLCLNCSGKTCDNVSLIDEDEDEDDPDEVERENETEEPEEERDEQAQEQVNSEDDRQEPEETRDVETLQRKKRRVT